MPNETRFADNFDRLLGLHRLTARRAAELLDVSAASLSYWRNGRREPDRDSLYRISIYFLVDPWEIMEASAHDFLVTLADEGRFDEVEKQIANNTALEALDGWKVGGGAMVTKNRRGSATMRKQGDPAADLTELLAEDIAQRERRRHEETVSGASDDLKKDLGRARKLRKLQAVRDKGEK